MNNSSTSSDDDRKNTICKILIVTKIEILIITKTKPIAIITK